MGPIGMPELIMIVVVLIMLAIPVGIVVALVWYFSSRSKPPQLTQPQQVLRSTQDRLAEIDSLRSQNLISEAEYEEKRRQILSCL
jgi:cytochrome c-type biogenesis protein CcmH/NrfG